MHPSPNVSPLSPPSPPHLERQSWPESPSKLCGVCSVPSQHHLGKKSFEHQRFGQYLELTMGPHDDLGPPWDFNSSGMRHRILFFLILSPSSNLHEDVCFQCLLRTLVSKVSSCLFCMLSYSLLFCFWIPPRSIPFEVSFHECHVTELVNRFKYFTSCVMYVFLYPFRCMLFSITTENTLFRINCRPWEDLGPTWDPQRWVLERYL